MRNLIPVLALVGTLTACQTKGLPYEPIRCPDDMRGKTWVRGVDTTWTKVSATDSVPAIHQKLWICDP